MQKPPETIENFLPEQDFNYFATECMISPHFVPCDFTAHKEIEEDGSVSTFGNDLRTDVKKHEVMFHAMIFNRPNFCSLSTDFYVKNEGFINKIGELLNVKKWWLIRVNCTIGQDKNYVGEFHNDFAAPSYLYRNSKTAIFYLNTNNGGTQFYDKDGPIVQSKSNTIVKFPTSTPHAGVWATNAKLRYVLNLNYE